MRFCLFLFALTLGVVAHGQMPTQQIADSTAKQGTSDTTRWFALSFQQTTVTQTHLGFRSPYSGINSLQKEAEGATSLTATFFASARLLPWLKAYFHPELAGGAGVSRALGVAGFMNGETFRVGDPKPQFYVARCYLQASRKWGDDGSLHLEAGKFSLADFFDQNAASHDPRSRFLNWALMSNGAWDYPANTRGYTWGMVAGIAKGNWALQGAIALEPSTPNGPVLDRSIAKNRGHVVELTRSWGQDTRRTGNIRLLAFVNKARMGNYAEAVANKAVLDTADLSPTRKPGRTKLGFGISADQRVGDVVLFARAGYNDGKNETWAFTEIDQSVSLGAVFELGRWKPPDDVAGIAIAANGISRDHQRFLGAGGTGFMIGDGQLRYGPECALEIFYLMMLHDKHFYLTPDYQFILNPGYNQDRGPVHVFAVRLHTEF